MIQRLHNPFRCAHRLLNLGEKGCQLRQRHDNLDQVQNERDQFPGRQGSARHLHPAVADNDDKQHHEDEGDERADPRADLALADAEGEQSANAGSAGLIFPFLCPGRLDQPDL
ncbi:hypothetical protein D3C71_1723340 [compost metagenome]